MPLKNCWEVKNCGREQGGARVDELGICPAYPDRGHSCWLVTGTLCGDEVQGTFAQKEMNCLQCKTYKLYNIWSGTEKLQLVSECVPELMLYLKDAAAHFAGQAPGQFLHALADAMEQTLQEKAQAQTRELIEANHRLQGQEEELRTQNMRFKTALDNMGEGLCMFDADMRLVVGNERYANMYQLPPALLKVGTPLKAIVEHRMRNGILVGTKSDRAIDERLKALGELPAAETSSWIDELVDGRFICITRQPMDGGGWVATHRDVTDQRRSEATMAHMAHHDALTDLPNRVQLRDHIEKNLSYVKRGETLAVLGLDLDHFKTINDTLGHPIGDALLCAVSERLRECVRDTDLVARTGGDEFSIVQVGVEQPGGASNLAQRLVAAISAPFDLGEHHVVIGTSVGIAVAPGDGVESDQLLKNADLALYRAKTDGRGIFRFFEAEMDAKIQARRRLELDLRKAVSAGEFELFYQPIVNLENNRIGTFEALLRWNHPTRGRVSPDQFIPLAEETGLIVPIGEWVIRQACSQAATWPASIRLAVNLSAAQFRSKDLVSTVVSALTAAGLAPNRLELEITETVLLLNNDATLAILHQLRRLGIRISMDDFGTGYSSLSYLRSFPFDKIKIDQSFVRGLAEKPESIAIIRAVVGLGTSLGITTTAEGIETQEQLDLMRAEGCNEVQGFYYSKPRPADDLGELLSSLEQQVKAAA
jgi:diguanylate cyclase (GGDEF)-like protein